MKRLLSKLCVIALGAFMGLYSLDCNAQTKTYRLLSKELDRTLWTIKIKDKKELTVINIDPTGKESAAPALPMVNAGTKSAFYVWDKRMKQFLVVNFTEDDRLLEVVADTAFTAVKQVTGFVADKKKVIAQKVYLTIEGITHEQAAKMPAITKIGAADIVSLKKAVATQKKKINELFPSENSMKQHPAVFMNSAQWLNMQCLIRGYKPPQNENEYEFLTTLVNH